MYYWTRKYHFILEIIRIRLAEPCDLRVVLTGALKMHDPKMTDQASSKA